MKTWLAQCRRQTDLQPVDQNTDEDGQPLSRQLHALTKQTSRMKQIRADLFLLFHSLGVSFALRAPRIKKFFFSRALKLIEIFTEHVSDLG